MDKETESLFNIDVFKFEECIPDENITYTDVEFYFSSLRVYNGLDIAINANWDIEVWDESEVIKKFNLIEVEEFQEELKKLMTNYPTK